MMIKKFSSFFILIFCLTLYDTLVAKVTEYSVTLDVFYFTKDHCFVLFWIWVTYKESRVKKDKMILKILSIPFVLRILLNLSGLFLDEKNYDNFSKIVSNVNIDYFTWITLITLLILILCQKLIILLR